MWNVQVGVLIHNNNQRIIFGTQYFTRLLSKLYSMDKTTRKAKLPSKTRSKEEKETKKAFEAIAKKLLKEQLAAFQVQIRSLISSNMDSVRHDMISIESSLSSRIITLESKVNAMSEKIDHLANQTKNSLEAIQDQQSSNSDLLKANIELERNKRAAHVKKLQDKISLIHTESIENIQGLKKEQDSVSSNLFESSRAQSKDIAALQEKVDEL